MNNMADKQTRRYLIHDTLEAYLVGDDDKAYFFGWTTDGSITRTITQEEIKGGIYNKTIAVMQTNDGMEFGVTMAIHHEELMEIQMGSDFKEGKVTVQEITQERDGSFTAEEKEVDAIVMDLNADTLPSNYKVQLRTIAYDPETHKEVADIYWVFDKATPDGNLNEVFNAGTNKTQEINFIAQTPLGSDSYGQYVIVPRKEEEEETVLGG